MTLGRHLFTEWVQAMMQKALWAQNVTGQTTYT
jgi:hypothetical protein